MKAFEFETQIDDGMIKIPVQHLKNKTAGPVKVIVLYEEQSEKISLENDFSFLDQVRLRTKGFQFDREEANAR